MSTRCLGFSDSPSTIFVVHSVGQRNRVENDELATSGILRRCSLPTRHELRRLSRAAWTAGARFPLKRAPCRPAECSRGDAASDT